MGAHVTHPWQILLKTQSLTCGEGQDPRNGDMGGLGPPG